MGLDTRKIKVILAQKEMNQSNLAKKCGMQPQALSEILRRGTCTLKTIGKIADAMAVSVTEIVKED